MSRLSAKSGIDIKKKEKACQGVKNKVEEILAWSDNLPRKKMPPIM